MVFAFLIICVASSSTVIPFAAAMRRYIFSSGSRLSSLSMNSFSIGVVFALSSFRCVPNDIYMPLLVSCRAWVGLPRKPCATQGCVCGVSFAIFSSRCQAFTMCRMRGFLSLSEISMCASRISVCVSKVAGDFIVSMPHSPIATASGDFAASAICCICCCQQGGMCQGCNPTERSGACGIGSMLFTMRMCPSDAMLCVCMSSRCMAFMVQGRSPTLPRDGSVADGERQGKCLSKDRASLWPLWHIASMLG